MKAKSDKKEPVVTPRTPLRREDLLDLNDCLQHPGRVVSVDISTELPEEGDLDLAGPLEGFLEAVSTGNLLLVTGKFQTRVILECSRCGEPVELPLEFELDEQFPVAGTPSSFNAQDMAKVEPDEPFALFEGNSLIVEALLREDLLINLPMKPLCKDAGKPDCVMGDGRGPGAPGRPEFAQLQSLLDDEAEDE